MAQLIAKKTPHVRRAERFLKIEYLPVAALTPDPKNARKHSKKQITLLAANIREFGFTNPLLIDEKQQVIAGHARLEAAASVPLERVPCVKIDGLTNTARMALAIADNKIGDMSTFDLEILSATLADLEMLDFNVELTGFETAEIDLLLDQSATTSRSSAPDPADVVEPIDPNAAAVSSVGDLWMLGDHRLLCGDALSAGSFSQLLGNELADLIFSDPPYNVPIDKNVSGLGRVRHREFAMAAGEMSSREFTNFLSTALGLMAKFSRDGSIHYVCMDFRHIGELLEAGGSAYDELKNMCVWVKGSGGMGSLYRSEHELVFVFKKGNAPHINNVQLGKFGRYRTNVWRYPGLNSFGRQRNEELASHPTVKPVSLVADAIRDCSNRGGLVLDAFAGSGTTIIAAERTRRRAAAIELDPLYVDTAVRRWERFTGRAATLNGDGRTFAEVMTERGALRLDQAVAGL
ncbi:site-specific DNA-methyltransferase [Sphingomonas sp. SUN019]|uniref:site-specific DNA-methyltransferase n=1 Tax=Sphingomonas sp. SUN019 TaxID=2937788 RepID=UPI0021645FB6|nr:DNA methyltransferase [Sphingomonas sp. SUN019]UVO50172.1 site-specific DNA-methyltransferase [Sphingomonas sp. SUN019]